MQTVIPTKLVGPIRVNSSLFCQETKIPLATLETPLWASVNRGARVSRSIQDGIKITILHECMTRSILLEAATAEIAGKFITQLRSENEHLAAVVATTSNYARLQDWQAQIVGKLIYLRFSFDTQGAAGHNMATKAAEALQRDILARYPYLQYVSISGNYCVDKKNSAVNGILGRGKYLVAEGIIPNAVCEQLLHTSSEKLIALNMKKNFLGSIIAGGVRTANAHFANLLLAVYLAFGQDAANIVEGSQGFTYLDRQDNELYFSITLPNVIVGLAGLSKQLPWVQEHLQQCSFYRDGDTNYNSRCLALMVAAVVWCGELSLLAAQAVPGTLVRSHLALERKKILNG